ncbi:unnamed protein product [marine sediment metagenome]|uniref:Uncharacterized protein n=1 Tax=marine sediment metagenome TaxID=412755 RepID=X1D770_9ZZZZ
MKMMECPKRKKGECIYPHDECDHASTYHKENEHCISQFNNSHINEAQCPDCIEYVEVEIDFISKEEMVL